ncbi:hypothetical protein TSOC_006610 [Tetrabaena socialis]|uniref:Uncharacterized protein n=1 Tax=Tetrabaena socialis TaxID=47790 RepID=A0A2J8A378_9CHLO|nr:hypothetical protein TSOC_006610 [Tetrabaena socialis]|eukprot:PNH06970.1 hypothetical protein TSOC_006610 [Tetrabaena socialis]
MTVSFSAMISGTKAAFIFAASGAITPIGMGMGMGGAGCAHTGRALAYPFSSLYFVILTLMSLSTRSTAPGLQWQHASLSCLVTMKPSRLKTFAFSVFQLYSFCCSPFAELRAAGKGRRAPKYVDSWTLQPIQHGLKLHLAALGAPQLALQGPYPLHHVRGDGSCAAERQGPAALGRERVDPLLHRRLALPGCFVPVSKPLRSNDSRVELGADLLDSKPVPVLLQLQLRLQVLQLLHGGLLAGARTQQLLRGLQLVIQHPVLVPQFPTSLRW